MYTHGITFGGHPVQCAIALKNIEIMKRERVVENVRDNGDAFRATLEQLLDLPIVGDLRGTGFFYALELVKDKETRETLRRGRVRDAAARLPLAARSSRRASSAGRTTAAIPVVQISPPLIATQKEFDEIAGTLGEVLAEAWQTDHVADIRLDRPDEALRRRRRRRRPLARDRARAVLRAARPVRLRQDDDAAHDRRLRGADVGPHRARRHATSASLPPYKRDVNTVFQSYALFPHLTVFENVAFGLRRQEAARRRSCRSACARRSSSSGSGCSRSASRASSRAASSSGSRSRGRSSTIRACCCSTSRSARST